MIAKLIVEGKEFPIEIQDPELQKLLAPPKKTGYERVEFDERFYSVRADGSIFNPFEWHAEEQNSNYDTANYYSSEDVAKNNARADKLMRQLRRFAVEHRKRGVDWGSLEYKHVIRYVYGESSLKISQEVLGRDFGIIAFDSYDAAQIAIDTFHDELIWYFTEYKDSL